ncbi:MAG: SpoIIE family protein phosphatase [Microthrixaceae bacterium]
MEKELEFATQVQLGFLPKDPPQVDGYEFADYYEPAHRVGGDYFDYIRLPNGNLAITVGDVAGKGVPAALLMARLHASRAISSAECRNGGRCTHEFESGDRHQRVGLPLYHPGDCDPEPADA